MKKLIYVILFIILSFSLFFNIKKSDRNTNKSTLLVSISPYDYFLEEITQNEFDVKTLIPSNNNPHSYQLTIKQIESLYNADIWFSLGDLFEKQIKKALLNHNPSLEIIDLCENIDLVDLTASCHKHKTIKDRHVWLSPTIVSKQVHTIKDVLSNKYPKYRELFEANSQKLIEKLSNLDLYLKNTLVDIQGNYIIVSHPDFTYFCKDYSLFQLPIEHEGKDPTTKQLTKLINLAIDKNIKNIIMQPQYNNAGAKLIAKKLKNANMVMVDPFSKNYFENLKELAKNINLSQKDRDDEKKDRN